jgi:hypothetical protein
MGKFTTHTDAAETIGYIQKYRVFEPKKPELVGRQ